METKRCNKCGDDKPISDFRIYNGKHIANTCRKCQQKPIVSGRIDPEEKQTCVRCGSEKERKYFVQDKRRPTGVRGVCMTCIRLERKKEYSNNKEKFKIRNRRRHLKTEYGLTQEQYDQKLIDQNYCCEICTRHIDKIKNHKLFVDHNHETKKVRGLICGSCNRLIALAVEDPIVLQNAINYLKKYN